MQRYYSLARYLRRRFGERVQKIPLDAGASCPHRDPTSGAGGCLFCNLRGSGSGLAAQGLGLAAQWELWRERYQRKLKVKLFIAYVQSFSNTHGPLSRLERVLEELTRLPDLVGLALGSRPDCLDQAKLAAIAAFPAQEIWLELGLQSANDATLARIRRGHDAATFARAVRQAAALGLKVCGHLIAGLPGEEKKDFLRSVEFCNELPLAGVKFHNLYVCETSGLAELWRRGEYRPLELEEYVEWLVDGLARLRPELVAQRLAGDPAPGELLAPAWAADKNRLRAAIEARLEQEDLWQGQALAPAAPVPDWFGEGRA